MMKQTAGVLQKVGWIRRSLVRAGIVLLVSGCSVTPAAATGCEVVGVGVEADRARALAACEQARVRFTHLLGVQAPALQVQLTERPVIRPYVNNGRWGFRWPSTTALRQVATQLGYTSEPDALGDTLEGWVTRQWEQILPHELGHMLFHTYYGLPERSLEEAEYGTPLPDWFDEAVAMWAEPQADRAERVAQMRKKSPAAPDLTMLIRLRHPLREPSTLGWTRRIWTTTTVGRCKGVCPPPVNTGRRVTFRVDTLGQRSVDTVTLRTAAPASWQSQIGEYYSSALLVMTYVYERGGVPAVRALYDRLRGNPRLDAPLVGLPGLPGNRVSLQADWSRWWDTSSAR